MSLAVQKAKRAGTSIYHKKITGSHQKKTKGFVKTYWPYLPVLLVSVVVLTVLGNFALGTQGALFGGVGAVVATVLIAL